MINNDMHVTDQALEEILNEHAHIPLQSLNNEHKANISARLICTMIDIYLSRVVDMEMNTMRYLMQNTADVTDRCM
jgi:hypothetical protein